MYCRILDTKLNTHYEKNFPIHRICDDLRGSKPLACRLHAEE